MDDLICKAEIETNIWTARGEREGERNWEIEGDVFILLCIK